MFIWYYFTKTWTFSWSQFFLSLVKYHRHNSPRFSEVFFLNCKAVHDPHPRVHNVLMWLFVFQQYQLIHLMLEMKYSLFLGQYLIPWRLYEHHQAYSIVCIRQTTCIFAPELVLSILGSSKIQVTIENVSIYFVMFKTTQHVKVKSVVSVSLVLGTEHRHHSTAALQWRHNGRTGVSNHQPHHFLLNCLFRCRSKKTSKLRVTGLCAGNSPETGEFPAQRASNAENVSIWWRHHGPSHSTGYV